MNNVIASLCFGFEIWTITLPEEDAIKFNDQRSKISLATSGAESIRLMITILKFLIPQLEQVGAFS